MSLAATISTELHDDGTYTIGERDAGETTFRVVLRAHSLRPLDDDFMTHEDVIRSFCRSRNWHGRLTRVDVSDTVVLWTRDDTRRTIDAREQSWSLDFGTEAEAAAMRDVLGELGVAAELTRIASRKWLVEPAAATPAEKERILALCLAFRAGWAAATAHGGLLPDGSRDWDDTPAPPRRRDIEP